MFSQACVILSTIGLMTTGSLFILVTARSVRILRECVLVFLMFFVTYFIHSALPCWLIPQKWHHDVVTQQRIPFLFLVVTVHCTSGMTSKLSAHNPRMATQLKGLSAPLPLSDEQNHLQLSTGFLQLFRKYCLLMTYVTWFNLTWHNSECFKRFQTSTLTSIVNQRCECKNLFLNSK